MQAQLATYCDESIQQESGKHDTGEHSEYNNISQDFEPQ